MVDGHLKFVISRNGGMVNGHLERCWPWVFPIFSEKNKMEPTNPNASTFEKLHMSK